MFQPHELLEKARHSTFHLRLLNFALSRIIPFNAPHKIRILKVSEEGVEITLPYLRKNLNHLKGLHACALAALSEYTCGLTLIRHFTKGQYRLIMKELQMTYHYQGREAAVTRFSIAQETIDTIKAELATSDSLFRTFELETSDKSGNHLCTAKITWQLKRWDAVRSKA